MPGSDKTVKVALVLDASLYGKGALQASAATSKLGRDMDTATSKSKAMESGLGRVNAKLGGMGIAAGAVAGGALVAFLTSAVKAAGDLQQSIGGVDSVFKDTSERVHKFGKESAEAVGLSTNEFNQLITATGAMLKNKGLEDFTTKSLDLVKIGADLAAQFGGPTSQAVDALNAAMRGESDPIERYGISLNETAVNAELARKGLSKLTGTALDQAKAQARIEIITRQSADAIGAFAREADTAQGQQQRLTAEWKNAQAELGTAMLPAVTKVTAALRDGVGVAVAAGHAWSEIPEPVKAAVAALVLYHLVNGKVATGVDTARDAVRRMREELALQQHLANNVVGGYQRLGDEAAVAGGKVGRTGVALGVASRAARATGSAMLGAFGGPIGLAVTGLAVAVGVFAQGQAEAKGRVEDLTRAIEEDSGALGKNTREVVANALEKSGAAKAARDLGLNLGDVTEAALGNADAMKRVAEGLSAATPEVKGYNNQANAQVALIDQVRRALGGQSGEVQDAVEQHKRHAEMLGIETDAQDGLAGQTNTTTKSIQDQEKAVKDLAKEVLTLADAHLSSVDAEIAYQAALDGVQERLTKRKELEAELAKAGGVSDRTKHLQTSLSETTDPKKRAKLERDLAESRSKDAKKHTDEQDRIRKELADYSLTLDLNTKAGRENQSALNDLAETAKRKAEADAKAGGSLKDLRANMAGARADFIENASRFGISAKAAGKMADEFGLTKGYVDNLAKSVDDLPASKQIVIEAETAAAAARLAALKKALAGIQSKTVVVTSIGRFVTTGKLPNGGRSTAGGSTFDDDPPGQADGGPVLGYSPHAKADNILRRLTAEEYVIKVASARKLGRGVLDYINTYGQLPAGRAMGGPVGAPTVTVTAPGHGGPQRLMGTLDMGDGLRGYVTAIVHDVNDSTTRSRGLREI